MYRTRVQDMCILEPYVHWIILSIPTIYPIFKKKRSPQHTTPSTSYKPRPRHIPTGNAQHNKYPPKQQ